MTIILESFEISAVPGKNQKGIKMKLHSVCASTLFVCFAVSVNLGIAQDDDSRMFYVKVAKGNDLSGQIVGISELKVTTGFGEVTIPVSKIEAVKMHADNEDSAVIAFTNGDMVTGKVEVDELQLKTNWGKARINAASIEAISSSQYGRFYSDPNGGGWRFSRGSATAASQRGTSTFGGQRGNVQNVQFPSRN